VVIKTKDMKVLKPFYCIQTNINYKVGDEYKGNRTDILNLLDIEVEDVEVIKPKKKRK